MTVHTEAPDCPNNSFIQLFEEQAARHQNKPFINYVSRDEGLELSTLTYGQFNCIANYLAHIWAPKLGDAKCIGFIGDEPVYSLLAMIAIFKLRRVFFPISTRVPEAMVTKILAKANTQYLMASEKYQNLAQSMSSNLSNAQVQVWKTISLDELTTLAADYSNSKTCSQESMSDLVLVLHSSGSTGVPKPILLTNWWMLMVMKCVGTQSKSSWGDRGIKSTSVILATTPIFHSSGILTYFMPLMFGAQSIAFRHLPPSSQDFLSAIEKYTPDIVFSAPVILYDLAEYLLQNENIGERATSIFSQVNVCLYGGDQVIGSAGEILVSKGLNVRSLYGTTEIGVTCLSGVESDRKNWYMVTPLDEITDYYHWEVYDGDIYQLLIRGDCPWLSLSAPINDNGYYETTDLFREAPSNPEHWIHISRTNDVLTMSNGKKIYPTLMEREIRNSNSVHQCSVIGEQRSHTAVLIELNMHHAAKCDDDQLISEVHAAVQTANRMVPEHSAIAIPEMVYILPPSMKLKLISKGTASRSEAIQDFKQQIEKMYNTFS